MRKPSDKDSEHSGAEESQGDEEAYQQADDQTEESESDAGDEYLHGRQKQKKIRKKTGYSDPFGIPPSRVTEEIFKARNPFLVEQSWMPEHCRFGETEMDIGALNVILDVALQNYQKTESSYDSDAGGELATRIKHAALLTDIKEFTRPSEDNEPRLKRRNTSESVDMHILTEAKGDTPFEGRPDFWIYVEDYRPSVKRKRGMQSLDPSRLVIVVEATDEKKKDAIYQAVTSASAEIMANFDKGHVDPVYVIILTGDHWTYAMLDIAGVVHLRNGAVTSKSYKAYKSSAKLHFSRILRKKIDDDSPLLHSRDYFADCVSEVTKLYRKQYKDRPSAPYPDGDHLVGALHILRTKNWYTLPNVNEIGGLASHGSKMFYEGLTRVVVGDRVKSWKAEDALQACAVRGKMITESRRSGGVRVRAELLPAYELVDGMNAELKNMFQQYLQEKNNF